VGIVIFNSEFTRKPFVGRAPPGSDGGSQHSGSHRLPSWMWGRGPLRRGRDKKELREKKEGGKRKQGKRTERRGEMP